MVDRGLVSQNTACCRHKNTERTPDTSPVWWKIVICKQHPNLQTQTHEMQTVASCVNTFGLVMHEICWNVALKDSNLQSENTPLLVGSVAISRLRAWTLQQTFLKILLLSYCLSWRAADLPFLHLHVLMASSVYLGHTCFILTTREKIGFSSILSVL